MAIALGTLAMLLGNVGLQVFNNWCNNRQNDELQRKREEFERAAREHQTDRMWKILREGQALTLELEKAKQEERLKELESEMGQLLQTLAYQATIENWPLGVLPIVMKNQALGNLLAHQEESFALHCIFTPSNYSNFNKCVFPRIEQALEEYCNKYWSPASTHPILFYSGAWKSNDAPSGSQTYSMRSALSNLPTLMITPFFRPTDGKLVFQIQMWGVGASSTDQFDVPEIEPKSDEFHFQRTYTNKLDYEKDTALLDEVVEDLVPYLQCLIGFMADTYFWSSAGLKPQLPHLVTDGTINTDGMKYLVSDSREYYNNLLLTGEARAKENPFAQDNLLNLYEGSAELWDEESRKDRLEKICLAYIGKKCGRVIPDMNHALSTSLFTKEDIPFIEACVVYFKGTEYEVWFNHIRKVLMSIDFDYSILSSAEIEILKGKANEGNAIAAYRLGEIFEYSIGTKWNEEEAKRYYKESEKAGFLIAKLRSNTDLYEQYQEEVDCLINAGVEQAIVIKTNWLQSQEKVDVALALLNNTDLCHPAILFKKANLLISCKGDAIQIERALTAVANNGYIKAQELLCELYRKGDVLKENPTKHAEYAEKAMFQNSPYATYAMALCYLNGYGKQQSTSVGILLIDKAEELGWPEAKRIKTLLNTM